MEINLETGENCKVIIDGTCGFKIWGERNEEGTVVMKFKNHNALVGKGEQ